jgi:hypothetical protein
VRYSQPSARSRQCATLCLQETSEYLFPFFGAGLRRWKFSVRDTLAQAGCCKKEIQGEVRSIMKRMRFWHCRAYTVSTSCWTTQSPAGSGCSPSGIRSTKPSAKMIAMMIPARRQGLSSPAISSVATRSLCAAWMKTARTPTNPSYFPNGRSSPALRCSARTTHLTNC